MASRPALGTWIHVQMGLSSQRFRRVYFGSTQKPMGGENALTRLTQDLLRSDLHGRGLLVLNRLRHTA